MSLLERIGNNKGTISSALGKTLAGEVLAGDMGILNECFSLVHHADKNVRSTCAKVIELAAEKRPELAAGRLDRLVDVFSLPEPQTRWMMLHVFGLCARLNPVAAKSVFHLMDAYVSADSGTCLLGRAIDYLGFVGELSGRDAERAVPYLEAAVKIDPRLYRRVMASLKRVSAVLSGPMEKRALVLAENLKSRGKRRGPGRANAAASRLSGPGASPRIA